MGTPEPEGRRRGPALLKSPGLGQDTQLQPPVPPASTFTPTVMARTGARKGQASPSGGLHSADPTAAGGRSPLVLAFRVQGGQGSQMGDPPSHLCALLMKQMMLRGESEPLISARAGAVLSPVQGRNCTGCGFPERGPASPVPSDRGSLISEPGGIPGGTFLLVFLIRASG